MLYIVAVLVTIAFALLVTSLVTSATVWAWISVTASVTAAVLLVVDWWLRRPARMGFMRPQPPMRAEPEPPRMDLVPVLTAVTASGTAPEAPSVALSEAPPDVVPEAWPTDADVEPPEALSEAVPDVVPDVVPEAVPVTVSDVVPDVVPEAWPTDADVEPPEELTAASDEAAVAELEIEVLVIDERPRYHVEDCGWLGARATIPLPLRQARELGFTPCGTCTPNAAVADRVRRSRSSSV